MRHERNQRADQPHCGDVESAASTLTLGATSNNQNLVPNSGLSVGGSGANRTLT